MTEELQTDLLPLSEHKSEYYFIVWRSCTLQKLLTKMLHSGIMSHMEMNIVTVI